MLHIKYEKMSLKYFKREVTRRMKRGKGKRKRKEEQEKE